MEANHTKKPISLPHHIHAPLDHSDVPSIRVETNDRVSQLEYGDKVGP